MRKPSIIARAAVVLTFTLINVHSQCLAQQSRGSAATTAELPIPPTIVVDPSGAVSVIGNNGTKIVDHWTPPRGAVDARVIAVLDGFDVEYSVTNRSSEPLTVSELPTPPLRLGETIAAYDFQGSGWPELLTLREAFIQGTYPNELYSPVAVLRTADISVGVSVIYPILDYKHDVSIAVESAGTNAWRVAVNLSNPGKPGYIWWPHPAKLPSGASRVWRLCFRFTSQSERWSDTLSPYVQWFRTTYGKVSYSRDGRPIRGFAVASPADQKSDNPEGWAETIGRPDIDGYAKVAWKLNSLLKDSSRVILWAATGLATRNSSLNYPHQFASRWTDQNKSVPVGLRSAPDELRSIHAPNGAEWGLWWGHAAQATPCFDCIPQTAIDPSDPSQLADVLRELNCGTSLGAKIIGLDAFAHECDPLWRLVPLLEALCRAAPNVKFCTEGKACDILHRLAPTWLDAYQTKPFRSGGHERIKGPLLLADLVLPGHETWAGMVFDRSDDARLFGPNPDPKALTRAVQSVISWGYVPVVFLEINNNVFDQEAPN